MNDHHSDPSAPKPDDASSRPVPPLPPVASDNESAPSAASGEEPTPTPSAEPEPTPAASEADVNREPTPAASDDSQPRSVSAEPVPPAASEGPDTGEALSPHWPQQPTSVGGVQPIQPAAEDNPLAARAGDGEPPTQAEPSAPLPPSGTPPTMQAAGAGPIPGSAAPRPPHGAPQPPPMPPGSSPTGAFAPAGPPPSGPPTSQIPMGGPSGPPFQGGGLAAPPKKKSKAPALVAAALVLALGAGAVGGVTGYVLAGLNGGSDSSSPSEQVANGDTISDIAKKVQPSVVSIATESAGGSGVVYDDTGHIITNNHVAETASGGKLEVTFADGSTADAKVVGTDPAGDLAVIKVDDAANLTPIKMGDSGALDVGDTVLAIGSPLGLDGSVTSGIVSALGRTVQAGGGEQGGQATTLSGLIQSDAAINPGNSGGALVNGKGELIGINTVIATTGASEGSVGLGFAIPSDTVASAAKQLIDGGGVEHGYLGVSVANNVQGSEGAVVDTVEDNSPAAKAGLKRGDVITEIDGKKVAGASDVGAAVQGAKPGTKVDIKYARDGSKETTTAELGSTNGGK